MKPHYFIEREVCWLLVRYNWTGCTSVPLRDAIMERAVPLINHIIRKQGIHLICSNPDDIHDLKTVAWLQIEKCLYKFRALPYCRNCIETNARLNPYNSTPPLLKYGPYEYGIREVQDVVTQAPECPGCGSRLSSGPLVHATPETHGGSTTVAYKGTSKAFSLFSMIATTVCLAFQKKQGRDRKHSPDLERYRRDNARQPEAQDATRFLAEAAEYFKYDDKALAILNDWTYAIENDQHVGAKYVAQRLGIPVSRVTSFRKLLRSLAHEFTDCRLDRHVVRYYGECKCDED